MNGEKGINGARKEVGEKRTVKRKKLLERKCVNVEQKTGEKKNTTCIVRARKV